MNLFRSEEHAKNWSGFREEAAGGLLSLADVLTIFSSSNFRERNSGRYISGLADLRAEQIETIRRVTDGHPFWAEAGK